MKSQKRKKEKLEKDHEEGRKRGREVKALLVQETSVFHT